MAIALNFTKRAIEQAVESYRGERVELKDSKTPGLILSLRPGGSAVFYLYRRIGGRPTRYKLGPFPAVTVEQARTRAFEKLGEIASGKDPRADRLNRRGELTIGSLFEFYLTHHAKPKKRSWREDEKQYKRYLKDSWQHRKLSSIRKADVQALHNKIGEKHGVYAANRLRSLLSSMFNVAADAGWSGANPVRGVKKFPEQKRERFLHADELPAFFTALEAETSQTVRDFAKVALLTGARKGNVQAMRWEQVNLERGLWTIPLTKAGESQTVHIPEAAVAILRERKLTAKGPWVFPGKGKSGHLTDPARIWKRIREAAGMPDLRIHDLRRTLGSWQAATGASLPIIGKSLGHRNAATTQIYARLELDPVRQSVNAATAAILAAAKPEAEENN